MTHDDAIRELRRLAKRLDPGPIASAFVGSLAAKPGFWRAPLIALAVARAVPSHKLRETFAGGRCKECGLSKSVKPKAIHERGQCLPGDLQGALAVLREVVARGELPPVPSRDDIARMQRLLSLISKLSPTAREGQLQKAMIAAKTCVGDKYDRRHVIETLGACGVLETPEHHGFTTRWTSFAARQDRPSVRVECDPPIAFWTAAHGVNAANVAAWFGHLGVKAANVPKATGARAAARTRAVEKQSAHAEKSERRAARATELRVGDAVAFAVGARWIAGVVVATTTDKGGRSPIVELCAWSGSAPPSKRDLAGALASGTKWGNDFIRARLGLYGLWTKDDPSGRWVFVASGVGAPSSKHLPELFKGFSVHRVDEMIFLARDAGLL